MGSLLISLLRHADRVKIACLAQLVNVIAPIRTEPGGPARRQSIYHPIALASQHGRGTVLRVEPTSPNHETSWLREVPTLDATAVIDEGSGAVMLFTVNRHQHQPLSVEVDLRARGPAIGEHVAMHDKDPDATNSATEPDRVAPNACRTSWSSTAMRAWSFRLCPGTGSVSTPRRRFSRFPVFIQRHGGP